MVKSMPFENRKAISVIKFQKDCLYLNYEKQALKMKGKAFSFLKLSFLEQYFQSGVSIREYGKQNDKRQQFTRGKIWILRIKPGIDNDYNTIHTPSSI